MVILIGITVIYQLMYTLLLQAVLLYKKMLTVTVWHKSNIVMGYLLSLLSKQTFSLPEPILK